MEKWADYLISEVVYDPNHLIFKATRHQDTEKGIDVGTVVDRLTISSDIATGKSYTTIYNTSVSWKKGHKIQTFRINGEPYIRIDNNKVGLDFLGDIPELQGYESELEQLSLELEEKTLTKPKELPPEAEEPAPKPEEPAPKPEEPTPEPPPESPRGSLPKDTEIELPQELELLPEDEPEPAPKPEEPTPEPPPESPRGSLPKDAEIELPQELELLPEDEPEPAPKPEEPTPKPEDESIPEQLAQLDDLKSQLAELENSLTNIKLMANTVSKRKTKKPSSDPKPTQLKDSNQNNSHRQRQKPKTTKSNKKKKSYNVEKGTAQLKKQDKKLDEMQNKLKVAKSGGARPSEKTMAYCVKCKEKRKVANAKKTIMKNGRPAVKGVCSACGCKVFRIVKKQ